MGFRWRPDGCARGLLRPGRRLKAPEEGNRGQRDAYGDLSDTAAVSVGGSTRFLFAAGWMVGLGSLSNRAATAAYWAEWPDKDSADKDDWLYGVVSGQ